VNHIKGTTSLSGLIGYPVKHSKSPQMHNTAFEALGLDYVYLAFEVQEGNLKKAVEAMKTLNAIGFNVTMPYKTKVLEYLDDISEEARIIGSVNTVKNENGRLIGYNTDGIGFIKSLEEKGVNYVEEKVVILGAGGAARAIATQLAYDGAAEVVLFNRTLGKAEEIAENINASIPTCRCRGLEMDESLLKEEIRDAAILVNCTSVGMKPNIDKSIIPSPEVLHKDLFVADIVYEPRKTKLLEFAERAGCRYMNGLMMVIWQGALAFNIWTQKDMPVDLIKKAVFEE